MAAFEFRVISRAGGARCGELHTAHGVVQTPAFMPVGTVGAVKAMTHRDLLDVGAEIVLANTYHLLLRPGDRLIGQVGGLHRFMGWDRPILTDSGGYQVFSLENMRRIDEQGVRFRSHLDGSEQHLTPERAAEAQLRLGSDIAMAFDECPSHAASREEIRAAAERTIRWAARSRTRFTDAMACGDDVTNRGQAQFGIVQGGTLAGLRDTSARETVGLDFDGYAIGGLSVGEPTDMMYDTVAHTAPLLPENRPRYLMGTGMPDDLVECVARGIDLFDCVLPTRNARNGQLLTRHGLINIKQSRYAADDAPPDPNCGCYTCRHASRAYLRHLYLAREMTAATLNTLHNLHFYLDTMRRIREGILLGSFEKLRQEFRETFSRRAMPSR